MWCLCGKGHHQSSPDSPNETTEKKENWFISVKRALKPGSKDKGRSQQNKRWSKKKKRSDPNWLIPEPNSTPPSQPTPPPTSAPTPPPPPISIPPPLTTPPPVSPPDPPRSSLSEKEQTRHAYSLAAATARAAEAAAAAAQAAAEIVRLTTSSGHSDEKSKHELAAIRIQTAFRGYLARRALRVLRGLKRLQRVMQGQVITRQTTNTLKTMQTLARMQTETRERRLKMAEENLARQKKIQQKHAKEQAKLELEKSQKNADDWDSSRTTKQQIEAKLQYRHEAAIRRERSLAYSYTHQHPWKAAARSANTMFMDQNNPHWGWSWMERWLATRPWETMTMPDKDSSTENSPRIKGLRFTLPKTETPKSSYSRFHNSEKPPPTSVSSKQTRSSTGRLSISSAKSVSSPVGARKLRSNNPKASPKASMVSLDDDAKSMVSVRSGHSRRNSCSSAKDESESVASFQTSPSYMAPTESAKARSRSVTPDRKSVSSLKKSSCTPSPARSRRSTSSVADVSSVSEHT